MAKERNPITYVQFIEPVGIGGEWASITSWQRSHHGGKIAIAEEGPWLVLTVPDGSTRWVPIHNVAYVRRQAEPAA